ncbi:MAG: methyltransferase domain-containing protein [Bryobacteraceae bacterium]
MSTFGDNYLLASGRTGHDRLRMLCEIHDPHTRQLLRNAGLGPAHRYMEFGCGLGYVARWAATQAAHVTATDLSQEQLAECQRLATEQGLKNIEFRSANIYEHGLAPESYDFSYSRWLLMHLNRPVDAMRKIREALKPGGIMVCEEADLSAIYTEPPTDGYHSYRDLAFVTGEKIKVDYAGGRHLHLWAKEAGFEILHVDAYQPHYVTGPHKNFWSWTFHETAPTAIGMGMLTEERWLEIAKSMHEADSDPNVLVAHSRTGQLIARKPL